ncbi:MAG: T9SS type A sorting domain-containing protein [Ignavibacteriaceae bacterium]|nr:T9SS type A sorting domain-containing protein [Ignavibacteriaceae bacterium]
MNKNPQYYLKSSPTLKIIAFLVFSFIFCQSLSSQLYWQKTYESFIGGDEEGYDGCAADGSNFYIVGYTGILDYYMYVLKMNQLGDTLWTRTYIGGIAKAVAPSNDGGCVFTGQRNSCFSMKLDLNGNVVWDKSYPNGAETRDITQTGDSGYVMCGGSFSGYICKLDTLGNLLWEKYYDDTPQTFYKIEPSIGGGYVVCGDKFINGTWKAYLMKIDGAGNIIWESSYQYRFVSSFVSTNFGFIILGGYYSNSYYRIVIIKTDLNGNALLTDTISKNNNSDFSPNIIRLESNKYIVSYRSSLNNENRHVGKVCQFDTNLNKIREINLFSDLNSVYLQNMIKAPDSNLDDIICFGGAEPNNPHDVDLYAIRIDSALSQPPPISVNTISNQVPEKNELIQNYPNPFNGSTMIKFTVNKSNFVQIKVFDVLGREVETLVTEVLSAGTYSKTFVPKYLSSGIYFYQFSINGNIIKTHKMVYNK